MKATRSDKGLSRAGKILGILPTRRGPECLVVLQALSAKRDDPIVTTLRPLSDVPKRYQAMVLRWMRELDLTLA